MKRNCELRTTVNSVGELRVTSVTVFAGGSTREDNQMSVMTTDAGNGFAGGLAGFAFWPGFLAGTGSGGTDGQTGNSSLNSRHCCNLKPVSSQS